MRHLNIKHLLAVIVFVGIGIVNPLSAHAVEVRYTVESISASDWRYNYTLDNDSLSVDIEEFTIYFDRALYTNLAVDITPADWDSLVVQPDNGIPANGYFDSLALVEGIKPGDTLSGFSVSFTYLGLTAPGSQPFEIIDPSSFNVIDSGSTSLIPEPNAYLLLIAGLAVLCTFSGIRTQRSMRRVAA